MVSVQDLRSNSVLLMHTCVFDKYSMSSFIFTILNIRTTYLCITVCIYVTISAKPTMFGPGS